MENGWVVAPKIREKVLACSAFGYGQRILKELIKIKENQRKSEKMRVEKRRTVNASVPLHTFTHLQWQLES